MNGPSFLFLVLFVGPPFLTIRDVNAAFHAPSFSILPRRHSIVLPSFQTSTNNNVDSPAALRSMIFTNLSQDQQPQLLCDFLMELGACSTSLTDAHVGTNLEQAIYHEPGVWDGKVWNACQVTAHFASSADLPLVATLVQEALDLGSMDYTVDPVPNRDWVIHVQQSWNPIVIQDLVLRFPWHTQEQVQAMTGGKDLVEIKLEGGVAFGTGEHPTTQLCLEWIQEIVNQPKHSITTLMDYGAGSGVLGLAASALSPTLEAIGVDIDVDAVRIANANAVVNKLSMKTYLPLLEDEVDVESKSMLMSKRHEDATEIPRDKMGPRYDALVANILAVPLVTLAPALAGLVKPEGLLGLSGILASQADMVIEAYEEYFSNVTVQHELNGWVLITGIRKLHHPVATV